MSKVIKLMADYDCFPTWEIFDDRVENINPNSLEISDQLKGTSKNRKLHKERVEEPIIRRK